MRIGVLAHNFGKSQPEALAKKISQYGFESVQLALHLAIEGMDEKIGNITSSYANEIGEAFEKYKIEIATLGCYINILNPEKEVLKKDMARFKETLRFAKDFGASSVSTETGSIMPDYSPHPDNRNEESFQQAKKAIWELVEEAEKHDVKICLESVTVHSMYDVHRLKRVVEEIGSNQLRYIIDPGNLLDSSNIHKQDEVIEEAFKELHHKAAILHAKDIIFNGDNKFDATPGTGILNYVKIGEMVRKYQLDINVIAENTRVEEAVDVRNFLKKHLIDGSD